MSGKSTEQIIKEVREQRKEIREQVADMYDMLVLKVRDDYGLDGLQALVDIIYGDISKQVKRTEVTLNTLMFNLERAILDRNITVPFPDCIDCTHKHKRGCPLGTVVQ